MLKLGILETGRPPAELFRFGSYAAMFRRLLGEQAYDYAVFNVQADGLPPSPAACDAWLLTGSASSAYEDLPWIAALKQFLVQAKGKAPLVGICFGHQVMAEAFGGKVARAPGGWGIGAHTYDVAHGRSWTGEAASITLPASHRDQVVELPPAAEVVARSAFTPFGALAYTDQPAISLQLHPEFDTDYAVALTEITRSRALTDEDRAQAVASLRRPNDRQLAARWIRDFLKDAG